MPALVCRPPICKPDFSLKEFMIFGVDPHEDGLAELLNAALLTAEQTAQQQNAKPLLHTYALIDGAFDRDWGRRLLWQQSQADNRQSVCSIYTASRLEALEECAPFLELIDCETRLLKLKRLLARTGGKPMLSFIQSPLDLFTLQRHLRRFSQVETTDTLRFPLRFADTICFPIIVNAYSESQRHDFMCGVAAWHIVNRHGGITTFHGTYFNAQNYVEPIGLQADCILFTDEQFSWVVAGAEADMLYKEMVSSNNSAYQSIKASILIDQLQAVFGEMDKRQITDEKERKELAYASLKLPDVHSG